MAWATSYPSAPVTLGRMAMESIEELRWAREALAKIHSAHHWSHQMTPKLMPAMRETMRTTVTLDDELLARAEQLCGHLERSGLLKEALRALVQRESAKRLDTLCGSKPALKPIPRRRSVA